MTYQHPNTPPPELVQQWAHEWHCSGNTNGNGFTYFVATRAAQWGADQELEACVQWIATPCNAGVGADIASWLATDLRAARRPKPPSLKEQALQAINAIDAGTDRLGDSDIIRRALEQLPDD
jgi:hypothetical protein